MFVYESFWWVINDFVCFVMIQNFVAEAASAAQNSTAQPPTQSQGGYNAPYPGHAPAYQSQLSAATHAPPAADYGGAVYGGNYGY